MCAITESQESRRISEGQYLFLSQSDDFAGGFLSVVGATTYIGCSDRPTKIFPRAKAQYAVFFYWLIYAIYVCSFSPYI